MKLLFIITCVITTLYLLKLLIVSCIKKYNKSQSILSEVSLSLPKCWKDLDEDDLLYVSTLFVNDNTKEDILTKCFIYFADLEVLHQRKDGCWICQKGKERIAIKTFEIQSFSKNLSFITDQITEVNPISSIRGQQVIDPRFRGITFKQWMAAENFYQGFLVTRQIHLLVYLCTTLYSRSYYKSSIEFKDQDTMFRSKLFLRASKAEIYSCFIFYAGFKHYLSKEYPFLFPASSDKSGKSFTSGNEINDMFQNMIYALSEGNVTEYDDVTHTECGKAFFFLNRKAQESKEMNDRLKKMKTKK